MVHCSAVRAALGSACSRWSQPRDGQPDGHQAHACWYTSTIIFPKRTWFTMNTWQCGLVWTAVVCWLAGASLVFSVGPTWGSWSHTDQIH